MARRGVPDAAERGAMGRRFGRRGLGGFWGGSGGGEWFEADVEEEAARNGAAEAREEVVGVEVEERRRHGNMQWEKG